MVIFVNSKQQMKELKEILKRHGISSSDFARMLGLTYDSFRSMMSRGYKNGAPRWLRAFVLGYKLGVDDGEKKSDGDAV
jgi:transcriptional regulator with XRE-family HTH domain